jgi:uncharacterized protein YggE
MSRIKSVIFFLFLFTASTYSQEIQNQSNQITVLGSVELKEAADQASFTFSVKGVGPSLRRAVEDANIKVKTITNRLRRLGVVTDKISTSQFYSGENLDDKSFWTSKRDYRAVLVAQVTVDSLKIMDSILYTISEGELEGISNISFSLKDELGYRRKARIAATLKAKEKAEDITAALGVTLGRVLNIEEKQPTLVVSKVPQDSRLGFYPMSKYPYSNNPFNPPSSPEFTQKQEVYESQGSGVFAQTISITSQVQVTFEIKL